MTPSAQPVPEPSSPGSSGAGATIPGPATPRSSSPGVIRIAAVVLVDDAGQTLLARKRGTSRFMQAGGKIDVGESPAAAAARELLEELGLVVDPAVLQYWGRFDALAANEADHVVDAEVFFVELSAPVAASVAATAEIEEIVWLTPAEAVERADALALAPLTRDLLLPMLLDRAE